MHSNLLWAKEYKMIYKDKCVGLKINKNAPEFTYFGVVGQIKDAFFMTINY